MNDWQAERLLSRSALQRMVQEMIEEGADQYEKTVMSGNGQPHVHLHDAIISDEAWHVKRVLSEDERVAELQRYVTRVVQYLSYCICGQHADQLLAKIKGCKFAELLRREGQDSEQKMGMTCVHFNGPVGKQNLDAIGQAVLRDVLGQELNLRSNRWIAWEIQRKKHQSKSCLGCISQNHPGLLLDWQVIDRRP
jgi:hypothetical protein